MNGPSKPDRWISRIRLSSQWVLAREGVAFRLVPKISVQTSGVGQVNCSWLTPPLASPRGHSLRCGPLFGSQFFHLPASLRFAVITRFIATNGRSDSRRPDARTVCPTHPPALAGLPAWFTHASSHSVSNHRPMAPRLFSFVHLFLQHTVAAPLAFLAPARILCSEAWAASRISRRHNRLIPSACRIEFTLPLLGSGFVTDWPFTSGSSPPCVATTR